MNFSNKSLSSIAESDLIELVELQLCDLKNVDFRPALPDRTSPGEREFLYDVASFANATGGDLLYGIEKVDEIWKLMGLQIEDIQAVQTRLETLVKSGIVPIIQGIKIHCVPLSDARHVVVIRIPQNWNDPIAVKSDYTYSFFSRTNTGRYPLDFDALRERFANNESCLERLRRFRLERLGRIIAGETTVVLKDAPKTVLHIFPLSRVAAATGISLPSLGSHNELLRPLGTHGMETMYNLDGVYTHNGANRDGKMEGYFQMFRNGCIEALGTKLAGMEDKQGHIYGNFFEEEIIKSLTKIKKLYELLTIEPPFLLSLSVLGVKGYVMSAHRGGYQMYDKKLIDRNDLIIPEIIIEDAAFVSSEVLRPVFDMVWNAGGYEGSINYNEKGQYTGSRT